MGCVIVVDDIEYWLEFVCCYNKVEIVNFYEVGDVVIVL